MEHFSTGEGPKKVDIFLGVVLLENIKRCVLPEFDNLHSYNPIPSPTNPSQKASLVVASRSGYFGPRGVLGKNGNESIY